MSRAGTFNAYLEYAQRNEQSKPSVPPGPTGLLALLKTKSKDKISATELAALCGLDAVAFRDALKRLADAAFVTIEGPPLSETVKLTPKGEEVANML